MDGQGWDRRVARAEALAAGGDPVLRFAAEVFGLQRRLARLPATDPTADALAALAVLCALVAERGPAPLAAEARSLAEAPEEARCALLSAYLGDALDPYDPRRFFPKAALQARGGMLPRGAGPSGRCPACGGPPQVGLLEPEGEGARRLLECARCLGTWPFRRIACVACGEADPARLSIHTAEALPHLRLSACATCRTYLKEADRTRDGRLDPVVDDLASPALDLWAIEQGWHRTEPNLAGL